MEISNCTRRTRRFLRRIAPVLTQKCNFVINWKTTKAVSLVSCKDKTPSKYHNSIICEFSCPGFNVFYSRKTERCFHIRTKEHEQETTNLKYLTCILCLLIISNISIKTLLELYSNNNNSTSTTCNISNPVFKKTKIIHTTHYWSLLLFKESLAIRRLKPKLKHGTRARATNDM